MWAPICAWSIRALVVGLLKRRLGNAAYGAAYAAWVLSFIVAMVFVSWTGMQMYGFNRSDPWQVAGWVVLFVSPFGLPLLFGAPVVFLVDLLRVWLSRRNEDRLGNDPRTLPEEHLTDAQRHELREAAEGGMRRSFLPRVARPD